jgi:argininosuccinate lyase
VTSLRSRFSGPPGDDMRRFSSSLAVDLRMVEEDVAASIAHAEMLGEAGIIAPEEADRLREGLLQVKEELLSGDYTPGDELEDVHMAVEARLVEVVGEVGKKLHTARSRNDQVATDVRLWLKRRLGRIDAAVVGLIGVLLDRVEVDGEVLIPGYTHLQRGQPILLGHHLLAHAWALDRDRGRLRDAYRRLDRCPLGAGALAGTPHPVDRERTAELLGFAGPVENAMDAVAARDHEQEVAAACAICLGHLSRMAEELVLWSTTEVGFVRLDDAYATGSSIMPQKRNPDAAELVRGKQARVVGDLTALLVLTRALPMGYNRDLQEGREALFHAVLATLDTLEIMGGVFRTLHLQSDRFEEELAGDPLLATELADYLAAAGVAFREAHGAVGRLVRWCEEEGRRLDTLSPEEAGRFHPRLAEAELEEWLDPRRAVERRRSRGGTAPTEVRRQMKLLRRRIAGR